MSEPPGRSRPRLSIDLGALQRNYRFFAKASGTAECGATIKADAYGLGAARLGPALAEAGCKTFFVAHAQEGAALRKALGRDALIYVYNGLLEGEEGYFFGHDLRPVLNSLNQVALWRAAVGQAAGGPPAALHIDTGMNRLGVAPRDIGALNATGDLEAISLALIMSHLACGDTPDDPMNARQLETFRMAASALNADAPLSLANSAGCLMGADYAFDLTRPGIGLYGGDPMDGGGPALSAVVRIEAPILQIRDIEAGEPVGYGASFSADAPMRLATVALGYADGFIRAAGDGGYGTLDGARLPVCGRVSMDLVVVDVTHAPDARPGRRIAFFGGDLQYQAEAARTISYELLTRLGDRFERVYIR